MKTADELAQVDRGDAVVQPANEACDDGVNDGSYGSCTPDCKRAPYSGDGQGQEGGGQGWCAHRQVGLAIGRRQAPPPSESWWERKVHLGAGIIV